MSFLVYNVRGGAVWGVLLMVAGSGVQRELEENPYVFLLDRV